MSVKFVASSKLQTAFGLFEMHGFKDSTSGQEHLALVAGELNANLPILTRIHSECLTGDSLFSLRCDCGTQLKKSMEYIAKEKRGIILYLRQEGRGIGLTNKIKAYHLQDHGADTVEANERLGFSADLRSYEVCISMLKYFNVKQVRLMTNNPRKIRTLIEGGIKVVERISLVTTGNPHNERYLATKIDKLGHLPEIA